MQIVIWLWGKKKATAGTRVPNSQDQGERASLCTVTSSRMGAPKGIQLGIKGQMPCSQFELKKKNDSWEKLEMMTDKFRTGNLKRETTTERGGKGRKRSVCYGKSLTTPGGENERLHGGRRGLCT